MWSTKLVNGKMIYKNSASECTFCLSAEVDIYKTLTVSSSSVEVPDVQLYIEDVIDDIFDAYARKQEKEQTK